MYKDAIQMNPLLKLGLSLPLFLFSFESLSDDFSVEICEIQANAGGSMLIRPCVYWKSVNGCSNGWIIWNEESPGAEAMYSTALTAFSSGRKVVVRISDDSACNSYYDRTSMIRIVKD